MHKNNTPLCSNIYDLTLHQKYWLSIMAAQEINKENEFLSKFDALCRANGVKIDTNNSSWNNTSSSFREQMKERQRKRREKMEDG